MSLQAALQDFRNRENQSQETKVSASQSTSDSISRLDTARVPLGDTSSARYNAQGKLSFASQFGQDVTTLQQKSASFSSQPYNSPPAKKQCVEAAKPVFRTSGTATAKSQFGTGARSAYKPPTIVKSKNEDISQVRHTHTSTLNTSTKRDCRGLPVSLRGSFDDDNLIMTGATHNSAHSFGKGSPIESFDFDPDDFPDDIELDVEQPKPVSLPVSTAINTTPNGQSSSRGFRPTLPRQQQVQASLHDPFFDEPPVLQASSQPYPWSSSPAYHKEPKYPPPQTAHSRVVQPEIIDLTPPVPKIRRTIPWEDKALTSTLHASTNGPASANRIVKKECSVFTDVQSKTDVSVSARTTTSKPKEERQHMWDLTASALKDGHRTNRNQARMNVKKEEVEEKATLLTTKKKPDGVAKIFMSEEQQHVHNIVVDEKQSVFFTGAAGTGKSVLLRNIIKGLRKKYLREPDRVAITASTGLAACNIGGVTLHSFAGVGLGKEEAHELVRKIKKNSKAKHRWMRTKVLIIDEISMVDADFFDKLETVARQVRNNGRAFGGIQLVITGDFFQLPPVGSQSKFAFDAASWKTSIDHTIALHQVFRQKDPTFAGMLNEMREGRLTTTSVQAFKRLDRPLTNHDEFTATELFSTRNEVDRANTARLNKLAGQTFVFEAKDGGTMETAQRSKFLANSLAPETLTLKKGAQVMLIKNIDENLVNGSIGMVVAFQTEQEHDKYTMQDDLMDTDESGVFLTQPAVEMSKVDKARIRLTENISTNSTTRRYPLVKFVLSDGTSRTMLCQRESWTTEQPNGEVVASRSQIPLILAWALSIHKAQGQTLERVKVDLGKAFEKGQAYVALSRATNMEGLQVLNFDATKVQAHARVGSFYKGLAKLDAATLRAHKHEEKQPKKNLSEYEQKFKEELTNV